MTEDEVVGWHHRLMGMSLNKLWELVMDREAWLAVLQGVTKSWTRSPLDKNPIPGHLFELHPVNEVNTKGQ